MALSPSAVPPPITRHSNGAKNKAMSPLWNTFLFAILLLSGGRAHASSDVAIGVINERDDEATVAHWSSVADYLGAHIPGSSFRIVTLTRNQFPVALSQERVDFLITSGAHYVELEVRHGISRIASVEYAMDNHRYSNYGAVIFTRHDRSNIQSLVDLRDKTLAAIEPNAFGDTIATVAELQTINLQANHDYAIRYTGQPLSRIASAVRDGNVDAGTMRAESFELLARNGVIRREDFRILNAKRTDGFPVVHSTQLYPSWPISKALHTSIELAERVATALIKMPPNDPAAKSAGIGGWTIPLDYQPVQRVLRNLRLSPFENLRLNPGIAKTTPYSLWTMALTIFVFVICVLSILLMVSNKQLRVTETKLRRHRARLSTLIQQSTLELVTARNQAMSAGIAKTLFLANITHDLQPPLNSILGISAILKEKLTRCGLLAETLDVEKVVIASKQLLSLISDILDISRVDEGKVELQPVTLNVSDVISDVLKSIQSIAYKRHNTIKTVIEESIGTIRNDVVLFKQLLLNVLKNACENTDHGIITLTVQRLGLPVDDQLILAVRDSGHGMSTAEQERAFEHFHNFFHASESDLTGRGLGLSISRAYCELMGGEIRLASTPGIGTEVWISIPAEVKPVPSRASTDRVPSNVSIDVRTPSRSAQNVI